MKVPETYKQELLRKYMSRTITDVERHELEKMALDDGFLFEAMEGFSNHDKSIEQIQFNPPEEKTKVKSLYKPIRDFLRMAAAFLLIAVAVMLLKPKMMNQPESRRDVAFEEESTETSTSSSPVASVLEKSNESKLQTKDPEVGELGSNRNNATRADVPEKKVSANNEDVALDKDESYAGKNIDPVPVTRKAKREPEKTSVATEDAVVQSTEAETEFQQSTEPLDEAAQDVTVRGSRSKETVYYVDGVRVDANGGTVSPDIELAEDEKSSIHLYRVEGTIRDEEGHPLIGATVTIPNTSVGVVTDFDGAFSVSDTNYFDEIMVDYVGYQTSTITINEDRIVDHVMTASSQLLDEVVVTEMGFKNSQAIPSMGMEAFNEYLRDATSGLQSCSGIVRLRFTINTNGGLKDFIVINSLSEICNQEAIRILKEGGLWNTIPLRKQVEHEIDISF